MKNTQNKGKGGQRATISTLESRGAKKQHRKAKNALHKPDWGSIRGQRVSKCFLCKSSRQYTNPFQKCDKCKKLVCYDCINAGLDEKINKNEVYNLCDKCFL